MGVLVKTRMHTEADLIRAKCDSRSYAAQRRQDNVTICCLVLTVALICLMIGTAVWAVAWGAKAGALPWFLLDI
jgi:hypothetical protein